MIIKKEIRSSQYRGSSKMVSLGKKVIMLLLLVFLLLQGYKYIQSDKKVDRANILFCDAETVDGKNFITNGTLFNNSKTRSSEKSYAGKFSSKLDDNHKYGFSIKLENILPNQKYIVTVRRYIEKDGRFALAINPSPSQDLYVQTTESIAKDKNGWEFMKIEITIPRDINITDITIFPYRASSKGIAYFDDLNIEILNKDSDIVNDNEKVHLYLDQKALNKINSKRDEALRNGILMSSDDDWVKAKLKDDNNDSHDIKLRLKGDWTDHLEGDYWSYRIKMPSEKSWNRMQTFSFQDPKARSYLDEWLYHKALESQDIITPRYGFIELSQNDLNPVFYAYEEHFEKQIAEYKNRREGVIVKFSEDHMWDDRLRNKGTKNVDIHKNTVHNAEINAFKESKTLKSPKLKEQFLRAQDLMSSYKNQTVSPTEVFDIELIAKYYALSEVLCAYHGLIWHNMRFYYNPITRKLEPIGYDGFTDKGKLRMYSHLFFGEFKSSNIKVESDAMYKYLYQDSEFNKYYIPALIEYSSSEFIEELIDTHQEEALRLENKIKFSSDSNYKFNIGEIRSRAKTIRKTITPYNENSIKAYRGLNTEMIDVSNYHCLPIEIIGTSIDDIWTGKESMDIIINSNGRNTQKTYTKLLAAKENKYIFYRLPNDEKVYHSKIKEWSAPNNTLNVAYSSLVAPKIPLDKSAYQIISNEIIINSGSHTINSPLVIPENYTLTIEPGCNIDIVEKAYILSYGEFTTLGTSDNPILINSSDKTSQGITIIKSKETCKLTYTSFLNHNTLEEDEWQLTGAVTFYESDVEMQNVTISNNLCEDALNIVRSEFIIDELNINNTFADGFDCDFCRGKLSNSYLFATGNDGLDYSGSFIELENIRLENVGDKGISAGEEATLVVNNTSIKGAQIGIASKDLSKVSVSKVSLDNCVQGFAAYRKKPEFGGATITVKSFKQNEVKRLINKDDESQIYLPK